MGQRHLEPDAELTIDRAARRLEVESAADVARAAFERAGELQPTRASGLSGCS